MTSYAGVSQTNMTSFSTPTTDYSSCTTATTAISITVERHFVSIETTLRKHQQQQDEMNEKLDLIDGVATESNQLIKELLASLKISSSSKGTKRGPSDNEQQEDTDITMTHMTKKP
jgi:hypothetical protein